MTHPLSFKFSKPKSNKPENVLVYVGDRECHNCELFKAEWETLKKDRQLGEYFYLKLFESNGELMNSQVLPKDKIPMAPCFRGNVRLLPHIFIIPVNDYQKIFDIETNLPLNASLPMVGKAVFTGKERTALEVKRWALSNV